MAHILTMRQKLFVALLFLVAACAWNIISTTPVSAYSGGRLIDDAVFRNSSSMSAAQIQSFLESKNSGLATKKYDIECYGANSKERELYNKAGASCSQKYPTSKVIYYAAKIYGVNPQVILATLQKEQSLITTTNPTSWQLSQAMGYGCPTTGSCSSESNFAYQIDSGTWVLRYHYERANKNNSWWNKSDGWTCGTKKSFYTPNLYPKQNVTFKDGNGVSYRTHYIENAATSAFYCYTPHAYNNPQGLYGLPKYGTKGEYYTGSYNFVKSFESWFGSTFGGINIVKGESSDTLYLIDRERKVPIASNDILRAWNFHDNPVSTLGTEAMGLYPTSSTTLGRRARSHTTNTLYYVDNGKAHRVHTSAIKTAWGISDGNIPTINVNTINSLTKYSSLSYFIKKDGGKTIYFVENGKKLPIVNPPAVELIRGSDGTPLTRAFSASAIDNLTTGSTIRHSFKVGSQWYVFDYDIIRKVNPNYTKQWKANGPTLSSNVLNFFRIGSKELKGVFRTKDKYYRFNKAGKLEMTTSKNRAASWGSLNGPLVNGRLKNLIK